MAYSIHRVNRRLGSSVLLADGYRTKAEAELVCKYEMSKCAITRDPNPDVVYVVLGGRGRK